MSAFDYLYLYVFPIKVFMKTEAEETLEESPTIPPFTFSSPSTITGKFLTVRCACCEVCKKNSVKIPVPILKRAKVSFLKLKYNMNSCH